MSKKTSKRNPLLEVVQMFVVAVVVIVAYELGFKSDGINQTGDAQIQGILVVDSKRLLQAQMTLAEQRMSNGVNYTQQQLLAQGEMFGAEFLKSVRSHSERGFLVIEKQFAVGVPNSIDITELVANDLGLTLPPAFDPFTTPVAQSQF